MRKARTRVLLFNYFEKAGDSNNLYIEIADEDNMI